MSWGITSKMKNEVKQMELLHQKVICPETVFAQEVDNEIVLLDMQSENYFGLDSVGAVMWQFMQEHLTLQDVLNALLEYYDVDEAILKKDLLHLVEQLHTNGLIRLERL